MNAVGTRVLDWGTRALLVLSAVATVAVLFTPLDSRRQVAAYTAATLLAVVATGIGLARLPRGARRVWGSFTLASVLWFVGDAVYNWSIVTDGEAAYPGPSDFAYLLSYVATAIALVLLVRARQPDGDREAWLDAAIMSTAAVAVVGAFLIVPLLADTAESAFSVVVSTAYPVMDVVVLAVLLRLSVGGGLREPVLVLVITSQALMLGADIVFELLVLHGVTDSTPSWLQVVFAAATLVLAVAINHSEAGELVRPRSVPRSSISRARFAAVVVGALIGPCLLVLVVYSSGLTESRLLATCSLFVIALVLWRVRLLFVTVQDQSRLLAELARVDSLTGLPNRRSWDFELERVTAACAARGIPMSVAILDLDRFKAYNDEFGHVAGDALLRRCASAWRDVLDRTGVFLARYGGEEFAAVLPGVGLAEAEALLELVRDATPAGQTVSIGIAERSAPERIDTTLERADRAMYLAKAGGRDRVVTLTGDDRLAEQLPLDAR